jgi:hypothetical protein
MGRVVPGRPCGPRPGPSVSTPAAAGTFPRTARNQRARCTRRRGTPVTAKASNDNLEDVLEDIAERAEEIRDEAAVDDGEPSPCELGDIAERAEEIRDEPAVHDGEPSPSELGVMREYWSGEAV